MSGEHDSYNLRGRVAVAGVGETTYYKRGQSPDPEFKLVLQAILNAVDFGMDAQQAVSAPRFCTTSDTIDVSNRILRSVETELRDRGYPTRRTYLSYHFAGVHALRKTAAGWDGGADPGRDGMALAV